MSGSYFRLKFKTSSTLIEFVPYPLRKKHYREMKKVQALLLGTQPCPGQAHGLRIIRGLRQDHKL